LEVTFQCSLENCIFCITVFVAFDLQRITALTLMQVELLVVGYFWSCFVSLLPNLLLVHILLHLFISLVRRFNHFRELRCEVVKSLSYRELQTEVLTLEH